MKLYLLSTTTFALFFGSSATAEQARLRGGVAYYGEFAAVDYGNNPRHRRHGRVNKGYGPSQNKGRGPSGSYKNNEGYKHRQYQNPNEDRDQAAARYLRTQAVLVILKAAAL